MFFLVIITSSKEGEENVSQQLTALQLTILLVFWAQSMEVTLRSCWAKMDSWIHLELSFLYMCTSLLFGDIATSVKVRERKKNIGIINSCEQNWSAGSWD